MNPTLKKILVISAKNAVNAVLVTASPMLAVPKEFNFHNLKSFEHVLFVFASAIVAREFAVWFPALLAWSNSPTNGDPPTMPKITPLILLSVLFFGFAHAAAQTSAPTDTKETGWNISVNGNFSNVTQASTNNGFATVEAFRIAQHWNLRADQFVTLNPSTVIVLAGPEYRFSLEHILRKTNFSANASKLEAFANLKAGTARSQAVDASGTSTLSAAKPAFGAGGGFDILVNSTLSIRPLDVSYIRASMFKNGGVVLGNHLQFESGLGLRF